MKAILTDLLAIIGVVLNGLPQGLLALTFGFIGSDGAGILCWCGGQYDYAECRTNFLPGGDDHLRRNGWKRPFGTLYDDFYRRCDYGSDRSVWTADKNRKLCR